jgi:hypothetical protein
MPLVVDSTSERQGFTDLHCTLAPRTAPDEANARPVDPGRVRDTVAAVVVVRSFCTALKPPASPAAGDSRWTPAAGPALRHPLRAVTLSMSAIRI